MSRPDRSSSPDRVTRCIELSNVILGQADPDVLTVSTLLDDLDKLAGQDLIRFDAHARSYLSGISWRRLPQLREPPAPEVCGRLWNVLALVSGDGYERERAVRATDLDSSVTFGLVMLRCLDWVPEVRTAALDRLDASEPAQLIRGLGLGDLLRTGRARAHILSALLDSRLTNDDLRDGCRSDDLAVRRAAWRSLHARKVASAEELLNVAVNDPDIVVRRLAARSLPDLDEPVRRTLAEVLINDPAGSVAVLALAELIKLDGAEPIHRSLISPSSAVRRAGRDWARIRNIDARAVYLMMLAKDPNDGIALVALADIASPEDEQLFRTMISDERVRVAAAGLRGLARVNASAGRKAAVEALLDRTTAGRTVWASLAILKANRPTVHERTALAQIALDSSRPPAQRLRCVALLRIARWQHLAVLLEVRNSAKDGQMRSILDAEVRVWASKVGTLTNKPSPTELANIERQLPTTEPAIREQIEFVLQTTR